MDKRNQAAARASRRRGAKEQLRVLKLVVTAADALLAKARPNEAASILQRYLDVHPPNPAVLRRLGRIRLSQGRPDEAAPLLEQALAHYGPKTR